jgi:hypothetical protein
VLSVAETTALAVPSIPGDYNLDSIVSHADFSVWGDTLGQLVSPPGSGADGDANGVVSASDFEFYRSHYGSAALSPSPDILPLSVTSSATAGGNVQWVFTFSHVTGTLGGHLNIDTHGTSVVSEDRGPSFFIDVPGLDWLNSIHQGIVIDGTHTFAALGATGGSHSPNASLVFMTLVTQGLQPTNLSITGQYGYQSQDYSVNQSASYVPEPAGMALAVWAIAGVGLRSRRRTRIGS